MHNAALGLLALSVVAACDGPSAVIGFHSGLEVRVRQSGRSGAELTDELNGRSDRLTLWSGLRNADTHRFSVDEEGAVLATKLYGDDWDLALFIQAMNALSLGLPNARFSITLLPEGRVLRLANGSFGRADKEVGTFVRQIQKRRRPNLEGAFHRVEVSARGTPAALTRLADASRVPDAPGVPQLATTVTDGALTMSAEYSGGARELAFLVDVVEHAWSSARELDPALSMTLRFSGKQQWERTVQSATEWEHVARELRLATGRSVKLP